MSTKALTMRVTSRYYLRGLLETAEIQQKKKQIKKTDRTHIPSTSTQPKCGLDHYVKILHLWPPIIKKSHVFVYIVDYLLLVDSKCELFTYISVTKVKRNC